MQENERALEWALENIHKQGQQIFELTASYRGDL